MDHLNMTMTIMGAIAEKKFAIQVSTALCVEISSFIDRPVAMRSPRMY